MAGYCSNLPWKFSLFYAVNKARWQVWQLFSKHQQRRVRKSEGSSRRIEITIGITCHTCHAFSIFGLGTLFWRIATCHQTCHGFAAAGRTDRHVEEMAN
jgi:hypothetical protein